MLSVVENFSERVGAVDRLPLNVLLVEGIIERLEDFSESLVVWLLKKEVDCVSVFLRLSLLVASESVIVERDCEIVVNADKLLDRLALPKLSSEIESDKDIDDANLSKKVKD